MKKGLFWLFAMLLVMTGCAAPKKIDKFTLFYPPPPEFPRLQWLTSFTGAKDIEPEKTGFEAFVVGEAESGLRMDRPYGLAVQKGKFYVCDTNRTVMIFDLAKKTFGPLGDTRGPGKLLQPVNISIDREGNKYVTDPVRKQVVVFDSNDRYVRAFGEPAKWKPVDAVVIEDLLYVLDLKNKEVVVLEKATGREVRRFGQTAEAKESLGLPTNLTFDSDHNLYVSDLGKFEVLKYDRDGHYLSSLGRLGTNPGTFARPKGVATDRENRLYVVDGAFDNVQLFTAQGNLLLWFGHFGEFGRLPGELYLPVKVAVDYDNVEYFQKYAEPDFRLDYVVYVVNQFGERLVQVFGFGKDVTKKYPSDEELEQLLKKKIEEQKTQLEKREKPGEDVVK